MPVCWGKERKFSLGAELARDLEPRTKVSKTLQPHEGDRNQQWERAHCWACSSPDSSMGSLSTDLRTWSDSPVKELSSILRSLPWMKRPSAGRRSPVGRKVKGVSRVSGGGRGWNSPQKL